MNLFLSKACFAIRELLGAAIIAMLAIGTNRLAAEEPLPSQDKRSRGRSRIIPTSWRPKQNWRWRNQS